MRIKALLGLTILTLLIGCGSGETKGLVTGQVQLDGTPVEMGQIFFEPLDGNSPVGVGVIDHGSFRIDCIPGSYKVVITGTRKIPGAPPISNIPGEEIEARESIIPKKYNRETTLQQEVVAGKQTIDFSLKK